MSTIEELRGELRLIRIRRQEIATSDHPSQFLKEYIRIMNREVEALKEIDEKFRHNRTGEVFRP